MSCSHQNYQLPPCPVCGGAAFMGSSEWGHGYQCCSDKCGMELKAKLDAFEDSAKCAELCAAVEKAESKLAKAYEKATGVPCRHGFYGRLF